MIVYNWSLRRITDMICHILLNKFDCFIAIEGNRGLGKSTLAFILAKKVHRRFREWGLEGYRFKPTKALLYKRKEVIRFFNEWNVTGIADEMVNVTFNRDFYNEDQKDLIKMINMNRDHSNLFFACVPSFITLDSQIKNLVKIRITVVRRGFAIIQTPNRSIYNRDKWDTALNEKLEKKWIEKRVRNPHYSKLTTFRGTLRFPKLTEKQEKLYQKIKNDKRNEIAQEKGIIKNPLDPLEKIFNMLMKGEVKNPVHLQGLIVGAGLEEEKAKREIKKMQKENGVEVGIQKYFAIKKAREKKEKKVVTPNPIIDMLKKV